MTTSTRRIALVTGAGGYVGPELCKALAGAGHDLVLHGPRPGLVDELGALGVDVEVATDVGLLTTAESWAALVDVAVERFGRIDAASIFPPTDSGRGVARGPFLDADIEDLRGMYGYFDSTLHALQAVIPVMREQDGGGQIVVFTSDAGARPEATWSLYGAIRAGQSFLVRAVALEHARDGVNINVIGSKNAVFAGFPGAPPGAATDSSVTLGEWSDGLVAETPLGRLGTMEELAAFALVLLDGRNRFQTAQYFSYSGGWSAM
jgi:NAD(P)-dependent dehydrogenase (short-subunit alcohol dehydrogenase family)